jgi:4-hydroxy-tetrahydrodipicolinate synthase
MRIEGPVFAILTPFDAAGRLDYAALDDYLAFLSHCGVRNIVANGTTGEFASLTLRERQQILERCRARFDGLILEHVSACSIGDCRTLLEHARDHADGVLLLPPFYFAGIDDAGCLAFITGVLRHSDLPAYLYNFPEHTQFTISAGLFRSVAQMIPQLAGIKDSGGDRSLSKAYKEAVADRQVFVGDDRQVLQVLRLGLDGSVTGCGNPVPELLVRIWTRWTSGDLSGAEQAQRDLDAWTGFRESMPMSHMALVKAAMGARMPGFPPHVRPPFTTADAASIESIRARVSAIVAEA